MAGLKAVLEGGSTGIGGGGGGVGGVDQQEFPNGGDGGPVEQPQLLEVVHQRRWWRTRW